MRDVAGFRAWPLEVNRDIKLVEPGQVDAVMRDLTAQRTTDLFVVSHGWRNDVNDAKRIYTGIFTNLRAQMSRDPTRLGSDRRYMILEIYWPSKKSADPEDTPGGAASTAPAPPRPPSPEAAAEILVDDFGTLFPDQADKIKELRDMIPDLERSIPNQRHFLEILRGLVGSSTQPDTDSADLFASMDAKDVFAKAGRPELGTSQPDAGSGGATAMPGDSALDPGEGGVAFLGGFFGGIFAKIKDTLDIATFYTMKERAGRIGQGRMNEVLHRIAADHPGLRLHLVGHSFGARLVTAAVLGNGDVAPLKVRTLTLLQAAFSHYGLSGDYKDEPGKQRGYFRPIVERQQVTGPIVITHSKNDKAVGMAYPFASRLAGQEAAGIGEENSPYGGMGRNGAQRTAGITQLRLLPVGQPYDFTAPGIYNLKGDGKRGMPGVIGNHGDIEKPEIAQAMVDAIAVP